MEPFSRTFGLLAELWRVAPPAHCVEFRQLSPGKPPRRGWWPISDIAPMCSQLEHVCSTWSMVVRGSALYFGVHPRDCGMSDSASTPYVYSLVADVDQKHADRWAALPSKLKYLESAGLGPSAVVDTGHGVHLYWFLEAAEPSWGTPSAARAVMYRLQKYLGSDMVHDPARVLRLPGSFNWKSGEPVMARVTALHTRRRFTSKQIESALTKMGVPQYRLPPSILKRSGEGRLRFEEKHIEGSARPPPLHVLPLAMCTPGRAKNPKLPALPDRILELIQRGHHEGNGFPSRSEADFAVVRALLLVGCNYERIREVFEASPIGARMRDRGEDYLARTVMAAENSTTPGCIRLWVLVEWAAVDGLPTNPSQPAIDRACLALKVLTDGEQHGKNFYCRFNLPDRRHPEAKLRWEAVWRAIGRSPPRSRKVDALKGREMEVEVAAAAPELKVIHFLPAATSRPNEEA